MDHSQVGRINCGCNSIMDKIGYNLASTDSLRSRVERIESIIDERITKPEQEQNKKLNDAIDELKKTKNQLKDAIGCLIDKEVDTPEHLEIIAAGLMSEIIEHAKTTAFMHGPLGDIVEIIAFRRGNKLSEWERELIKEASEPIIKAQFEEMEKQTSI
jgi:uncharacterized protein YdcH (DUF465 family)